MHILVFEPTASGHHMALYLKLFVRAVRDRGWSVTLLSTEKALRDPAFELVRAEGVDLDLVTIPPIRETSGYGSLELFQKERLCLKSVKAAMPSIIRTRKPDVAFVMNLGHFEKAIAVLGSPFGDIPWAGIMISAKFHRYPLGIGPKSRNDALYQYLFRRMLELKTLRAVAVIDELFLDYVEKTGIDRYSKVMFIPDVGELHGAQTKAQARSQLGIRAGEFVILVYGSLSRRKGVEQLLRALAEEDIPRFVTVHLAGRQDAMTRAYLQEKKYCDLIADGRVVVSDEFHDEAMEYRAFISADAVWLGYVGGAYGSSGVLCQACSVGLPVIATHRGLIGWLTTKHHIGAVVDPEDSAAVAKCITELVFCGGLRKAFSDNTLRLAERHTVERFMDAVVMTIMQTQDSRSD